MATRDWPNIPAMFFDWAERRGERPFLWGKRDGQWQSTSWRDAAITVRALTAGLARLGIQPGDRVAIVMENRPEWVLADLAILTAGAITVPAYTTFTTEDYRHVLADSGAKALFLGAASLADRVLAAADQLADLTTIITLEPIARQTRAVSVMWHDLLAADGEAPAFAAPPDDTACLIYTSGTGGVPKGVMLTHRNMLSNAEGARKVLGAAFPLDDEVFLSVLPLTHSYEHTAGLVFPLSIGAQTYFTTPESLASDMVEVRPTIMTAVPRLCETLQKRITGAIERSGGRAAQLFQDALRIGRARHLGTPRLSVADRLLDPVLTRLVRRRIAARFGGRLKVFVSGGAPLNPDVALFFLALGVMLIQGYGQTETGPVVGVNPPRRIKVDTVGPPLDGVEVRIAEDGEILVRGPNVMKGYWRDPEATARTIIDGWLHTGDVGELDPDGYLKITDRKRDFIKNSGGDMISPQRIEGFLTLQKGVAQAMVHGDRKPYLVALLVPEDGLKPEAARQLLTDAVAKVNETLTSPERIRRFAIADGPFTVANGQMTPTLKIKRHMIRQAYGAVLEGL